jgi:methionyl-tRNA formyltransferase
MGTPAFAVPALKGLLSSEHQVLAVYSQPPRPAGRGQKLTPSPIQQLAEQYGLPVHTPVSLKSEEEQERFRAYHADAVVVAAYGLLLPPPILQASRYGCFNLHPSDLPRWRGAAPLQRTILAGDRETALCIMQMDEGLDTGDVLLRQQISLPPDITAGEWHDRAARESVPLLLQVLEQVSTGTACPQQQAQEGVTYAHKIRKEEAPIDWSRSCHDVLHHIHGMNPFPGATFMVGGERWKALRAECCEASGIAGTTLDDQLTVACGEGSVRLLSVQRPNKAILPTADALRGAPIPAHTALG